MDTANDPIRHLLETTGLSCEDLLQKLLLYKSQNNSSGSKNNSGDPLEEQKENGDKKCEVTSSKTAKSNSIQLESTSETDENEGNASTSENNTQQSPEASEIENPQPQAVSGSNRIPDTKDVEVENRNSSTDDVNIKEQNNSLIDSVSQEILPLVLNAKYNEDVQTNKPRDAEPSNLCKVGDKTINNTENCDTKSGVQSSEKLKHHSQETVSDKSERISNRTDEHLSNVDLKSNVKNDYNGLQKLEESVAHVQQRKMENDTSLCQEYTSGSKSTEKARISVTAKLLYKIQNVDKKLKNCDSSDDKNSSPDSLVQILSENEGLVTECATSTTPLTQHNDGDSNQHNELMIMNNKKFHNLLTENKKIDNQVTVFEDRLNEENQSIVITQQNISGIGSSQVQQNKVQSDSINIISNHILVVEGSTNHTSENLPSDTETLCESTEKQELDGSDTNLNYHCDRKKSISDELDRLSDNGKDKVDVPKCIDDENFEENAKSNFLNKLTTDDDNKILNDVEICQIEDSKLPEVVHKPLLMLRKDLFSNDRKTAFDFSDEEKNEEKQNSGHSLEQGVINSERSFEDELFTTSNTFQISSGKDDSNYSPSQKKGRVINNKLIRISKPTLKHSNRKFKIIKYKSMHNCSKKDEEESSKEVIPTNFQIPVSKNNPFWEEEVRRNLKLQLCSLRNRKKTTSLTEDTSEQIPLIKNLKINFKKRLLSKENVQVTTLSGHDVLINSNYENESLLVSGNTSSLGLTNNLDESEQISSKFNLQGVQSSSSISDNNEAVNSEFQSKPLLVNNTEQANADFINDNSSDDNNLFSLSNETAFKIVDVQGGVEFPIDDYNSQDEEQSKSQSDTIKLTKTNDITKIKGWKKKKFELESQDNLSLEKGSNNCVHEMAHNDATLCSSNDNSNATMIITGENSNEELSPFVSNTLEEFLTENSTLNISYKIPRLGAEEGFNNEKYKDVILPPAPCSVPESEIKEKPSGIKPKTLAEKRRMLEEEINTKKLKTKEQKMVITKKSFVYYNGQKLYVPSNSSNQCLGNIVFKPIYKKTTPENSLESNSKKKISLINSYKKESSIVYKPGPLSKKCKLQNIESQSMWQTTVRKLPEVKLEIIPEPGKPIPPHLVHLLPKMGSQIRNDYLEFALSSVRTKSSENEVKTGFRFSVPYANNQKYILARNKKIDESTLICDVKPEKNNVESVIDDLITYVEHKEEGDLFIKDAEPYTEEIEDKVTSIAKYEISINDCVRPTKPNRLKSEMHRLSCKVVEVTVDETEIPDQKCQRSFCKMGCICRSLACTPRLLLHCSNEDCMFECKCSKIEKVSVNGETPLLSNETLTRIENQVKKNLAKIEKEFTQTIIHANDNTILVPVSGNRRKRITRAPKRFYDYLEDFENLKDNLNLKRNEVGNNMENNCQVLVENLNLTSVIPFCLEHSCYNCHCINDKSSHKGNSTTLDEPGYICNRMNSLDLVLQSNPEQVEKSREPPHPREMSQLFKFGSLNKKNHIALGSDNECSRTLGVHHAFKLRNQLDFYRKKLVFGIQNFQGGLTFDIREESGTNEDNELIDVTTPLTDMACNLFKLNPRKRKQVLNIREDHVEPVSLSDDYESIKRRKKSFKFLKSKLKMHKKIAKLQKEKRSSLKTGTSLRSFSLVEPKSVLQTNENDPPHETERSLSSDLMKNQEHQTNSSVSIFDGEIIVPTHDNKEFVEKLGLRKVAPHMRLLPWKDLLKNYYDAKINVWVSKDKSDKLLINTFDKESPAGFVDIRKATKKNCIVTWILTQQLPKQTPTDLVHLILSPWNGNFEIAGICLKNQNSENKDNKMGYISSDSISDKPNKQKDDLEITEAIRDIENIDDQSNQSIIGDNEMNNGDINEHRESEDPNFLEHKNHKNETNVLCLVEQEYFPQKYYLAPGCEGLCNEKFPITLELPSSSQRWRMLYLNSNFTFLSFVNNKYSIKYNDLMHILKRAQNSNKTICLHSKQLNSGYSQRNYGIYAVPRYRDRLFIGPYRNDEEHGLLTLRYLRKSLVSSSYFEMVHGIKPLNAQKAVWLVSRMARKTSQTPSTPSNTDTVLIDDAAKNITAELELVSAHTKMLGQYENFVSTEDLEEPVKVFPQFTLINGRQLKPQEYNRFIMTNIPRFGFLGAKKLKHSNIIEVDWPVSRIILKFKDSKAAIDFLRRRFTNLMLPVPESFQIKVIISKRLDSAATPVNKQILCGTYLCGEFGTIDSRKLTAKLAQCLDTSQEEILGRLAERAKYLGVMEIEKLSMQEKGLIEEKKKLIRQKMEMFNKFMELLSDVPEKKRLKLFNKYQNHLNDHQSSAEKNDVECIEKNDVECIEKNDVECIEKNDVECIEIDDSDEDSQEKEMTLEQILQPSKENSCRKKSPVSFLSTSEEASPKNEYISSLPGYKFRKTSEGKVIFMKSEEEIGSHSGIKLLIQNNKVIMKEPLDISNDSTKCIVIED